ncbi:MAG TPA: hypothetical protein VK469_20250 [Candidatus Kapabacteria bacterium]|nr:hypothetical protein [Candidatus Kapabacteria bacterium]
MIKNMLLTFIVVTAILLILLINCNHSDDIKAEKLPDKIFPISFQEEKAIRIDIVTKEPPVIADINDPDNIYIYFLQNQDKNCEVIKLSNDLEIKNRYFIGSGVGPGEALNPRIYGGDDRSIIVYDVMTRKFIEFDRNFKLMNEYKSSKNLGEFFYSGGKYIPELQIAIDGFRYIDSMVKESGDTLVFKSYRRIYTRKFMPNRSIKDTELFETPLVEERWENNLTPVFRDINFGYYFGHIFILDKMAYRIKKMTLDSSILKDKQFSFEAKTFSKSDLEEWVTKTFGPKGKQEFSFPEKLLPACWMMPIANGIAVGRCNNYNPDEKGPIIADYFDPDLNYLGKITVPYFWAWNRPDQGQCEAYYRFLYKNGALYSVQIGEELDDFQVVRWGVNIEKN